MIPLNLYCVTFFTFSPLLCDLTFHYSSPLRSFAVHEILVLSCSNRPFSSAFGDYQEAFLGTKPRLLIPSRLSSYLLHTHPLSTSRFAYSSSPGKIWTIRQALLFRAFPELKSPTASATFFSSQPPPPLHSSRLAGVFLTTLSHRRP